MDWNKLWHEKNSVKKPRHTCEYWNDFAPKYRKDPKRSTYDTDFLNLADIKAGESVFDMGCASGTLALPLAEMGHKVFAADFSDAMLNILNKEIKKRDLSDKITTYRLDWNEDWSKHSLPVCDVAIASRSMLVEDLSSAIDKLSSRASKKVCIVEPTGETPHFNTNVANYIGFDRNPIPDYVYLINILFSQGLTPELRYIDSYRVELFDGFEDCIERMKGFFTDTLTSYEEDKLIEYTKKHLVSDGNGKFIYDEEWPVRWAYISWSK